MNRLLMPLLVLAFTFYGCENKKENDPAATIENENATSTDEIHPEVHTIYSDSTELFIEFMPMIKGEPVSFAAHLTRLGESFTPITKGSVTAELIVMGKVVKTTSDKPSSPGIFRLKLTPEQTGRGALVFHISTPEYNDKITISGVMVHSNSTEAARAAHSHADPNEISFTKELAWKIDFASVEVNKAAYHQVIKATGEVESAPGDQSLLISPASGKINYSENVMSPGMKIDAATKLFTLAPSGIGSENTERRYLEAKSRFETAKASYDRSVSLAADKIISQKEFEAAKMEYESAQADYNNVGKYYEPGKGMVIKAGTAGYLKKIYVSNGQFVNSGEALANISGNNRIRLQVNVADRHFDLLPEITGARFRSSGVGRVYRSEELNGKVISYGISTEAGNPMIPVVLEMDHPPGLVSGTVVEVFLLAGGNSAAITIPVTALIEEQGKFFVYIQKSGESFLKREVSIGTGDGIVVPVLSGINEGERVVAKGGHYIKLTAATGSVPAHGHEH